MGHLNILNKYLLLGVIVVIGISVGIKNGLTVTVNNPMTENLDGGGYNIFNLADITTKGPWVDVRAYASFSAAIDTIGASEKTLLISDSQAVTANKTVPSNVTLKFLQGGKLNISGGVTVTINGHVDAELSQIFTGVGTVNFGAGSVKEVYPQWWGAKGDGITDDYSAMLAAVNSISTIKGKVKLANATYKINTVPLTLPAGVTLEGSGIAGTKITTSAVHVDGVVSLQADCSISDIYIDHSLAAGKGIYATGGNTTIKNCKTYGSGANASGIHVYNSPYYRIEGNMCEATTGTPNHQIYVDTSDRGIITGNYVLMNQQLGGNATIRVTNSNYTTISNNRAVGGNVSVLTASNYATLANNVVINSSGDGVSVGNDIGASAFYGVSMIGNVVRGSTDMGMSAGNVANFTITGNSVEGASTTGISILDAINGVISGNTCINNGQNNFISDGGEGAGINILQGSNSGCRKITISNNTVGDLQGIKTQEYGIYLNSYAFTTMSEISIIGNKMYGNATSGLYYDTIPTAYTSLGNDSESAITNKLLEGSWIGIGTVPSTGIHLKGPSSLHAGITFENTFASNKYSWKQYNNGDFGLENSVGGLTPFYISAADNSTLIEKLKIGGKLHYYGTAAPTTGTWAQGDIVYNTAPVAGGYIGWVCTTGGAPGTWNGFGNANLTATAIWDPPSIANGAAAATTVTVTGAALGDTVVATFDKINTYNMVISGHVQAAGTVRVVLNNHNGGSVNLVSGTVRVDVWKH